MKTLYTRNRKEWRNWLETNYDKAAEIYLSYYKKETGKSGTSYAESVEEALCFGWIDGIIKKLDEGRYVRRFTPRKPKSIWSIINKGRIDKMTKAGLMHPAGIKQVQIAKENGQWEAAYQTSKATPVPEDLKEALKSNKVAWEFFQSLSNSNKFSFIYHVNSAKREATKIKRIKSIVDCCAQQLKPYSKDRKKNF